MLASLLLTGGLWNWWFIVDPTSMTDGFEISEMESTLTNGFEISERESTVLAEYMTPSSITTSEQIKPNMYNIVIAVIIGAVVGAVALIVLVIVISAITIIIVIKRKKMVISNV